MNHVLILFALVLSRSEDELEKALLKARLQGLVYRTRNSVIFSFLGDIKQIFM